VPGPVVPPANQPTLDPLHPKVVALVRRCFADGHHNPRLRPTAEEWEQALGEAEQALVRCGSGHDNAADESYCQRCARPLPPAQPCRHCGQIVPSNAPYCIHCGRPVASPTSLCPNCRYANAAGEVYCQRCGRPLTGSRPRPRCGQQMPANLRYCLGCGNQV